MNKLRQFLVNYSFVVIPVCFVAATVLMDIAMYLFMGLRFPSRYYFSLIVMIAICGLLFFIKKSSIQYGICIFLLAVHFAVGVANIILFDQAREIVSLESLSAARQVATLTDFIILDFSYMLIFSLILLAFICFGIWILSVVGRNRKRLSSYNARPYRRNVVVAVATLSIVAYLTGIAYSLALPKIAIDASKAYSNYNNDRFVYTTFTNRLRVLQEFGTYSYYWSNLSFALGMKQEIEYYIPNQILNTFTFPKLEADKQNVIILQMETLERNLIHPLVMPNLYNFLYNDGINFDKNKAYIIDEDTDKTTAWNTIDFQGRYAVDRTSIAEYSALAGVHLDGVEMNAMPLVSSPFALPNILARTNQKENIDTPYTSIKAFHNYYSYMYNRDRLFTNGLGFDEYVALLSTPPNNNDMVNNKAIYGAEPSRPENETRHYNTFNMNSDYKMFESQILKMAPTDKKFFSYINNISTHMPYYDAELFKFYETSGKELFGEDYNGKHLDELRLEYEFLNEKYPQRTQNAVKSFLTGAREYDRGLGVLFGHLHDKNLLDKTTIIMYGDHYNNTAADLLAPTKEAATDINPVDGGAKGKMLAFYIYSPAFEHKSLTEKFEFKDGNGANAKVIDELTTDNRHFNKTLGNPNLTAEDDTSTEYGVIKKFLTTYDVYATICDILHIKFNTRFTLGISAFHEQENIGFSVTTGLIYNDSYAGYSLSDFTGKHPPAVVPTEKEIAAMEARLSHHFTVMNNMRPLFRTNKLRYYEDMFYYVSAS